ncbi:MAG TPA: hypothetical protein VFZ69_12670 [Longimicrobiales bacterium]
MRRAAVLVALCTVVMNGCGLLALSSEPDPGEQLNAGVAALASQDYARARALLEPLYREHWRSRVGQQALVALIASELDNRNPQRRLWAAADMAARLLTIDELQPWLVPVGESYYLLSLELGAQEERLARADSARAAAEAEVAAAARELPASTLESVPARINRITTERDALRRRVTELEQLAEARDKELRDTKQELERVKQTIRH